MDDIYYRILFNKGMQSITNIMGDVIMISSLSSSMTTSTASIMYEQQIQALDSQAMRLESQISGLQEKIIDVQTNERMSADEKKQHVSSINEQISQIKDRIQEIGIRKAEAQKRQMKAENDAKKQQQASELKAAQTNSEEEDALVDRALLHAIIGIDQKPSGLNATKAQLNSRLREAKKEDIFRIREDGKMVMIQNEHRRPRDYTEAQNVKNRIANIDASLLRDQASKADVLKKANENNAKTEKLPTMDEDLQNENNDRQRSVSGTGRMEKGQYVEEKA